MDLDKRSGLLQFSLLSALASSFLFASQALGQTTHYVDNLGDCEALMPCHVSIMDAVNAAAPSDTIEVFPGVYHEAVVIGTGKDNLVLTARTRPLMARRARTRPLMPVIAAPPEAPAAALQLFAPGFQLRYFELEAGLVTNGLVGSTNAVIEGNRFNGGIWFVNGCRSSVVRNNQVGGGITSGPSDQCVFDGNDVQGGITIGWPDVVNGINVIRRNVVRGGGITFPSTRRELGETIESNWVQGGSISVGATTSIDQVFIQNNVVRGGGIEMKIARFGLALGSNRIAANFVSASPVDGIALRASGGATVVTENTSVDNAGCDVNDTALTGNPQNTWTGNRFRTQCGAAVQ